MTGNFKTSLFGYSKREVCEYISGVSDKLTQKHREEEEKLREKIQLLEKENAELKKQLALAKNDNTKVSEIEKIRWG